VLQICFRRETLHKAYDRLPIIVRTPESRRADRGTVKPGSSLPSTVRPRPARSNRAMRNRSLKGQGVCSSRRLMCSAFCAPRSREAATDKPILCRFSAMPNRQSHSGRKSLLSKAAHAFRYRDPAPPGTYTRAAVLATRRTRPAAQTRP